MSGLSSVSRRPLCLSCFRRLAQDNVSAVSSPTYTQVRGKKKQTKDPSMINVRLLIDMPGFGKQGTITPVPRGRMRNTWYPRGQAEYLSTVSDINPRTVVAERDFTFGLSSSKESQLLELNTSDTKATKHNARLVKQLTSLTAQEKLELLSTLIPIRLIFHKAAILDSPSSSPSSQPAESQTQERDKESPQARPRALSSAAHELDLASAPAPKPSLPPFNPPTIFGSLTPTEIAAKITTTVRSHNLSPEQAAKVKRLTVSADDVTITGRADVEHEIEVEQTFDYPPSVTASDGASDSESTKRIRRTRARTLETTTIRLPDEEIQRREALGVEDNRIKALGDYWVDIRVRGAVPDFAAASEIDSATVEQQQQQQRAEVDAEEGVVKIRVRVE